MSASASASSTLLPEGKLLYQSDFPVRWGGMDALGYANNVLYAGGSARVVGVDAKAAKSVRMPESVRQLLTHSGRDTDE